MIKHPFIFGNVKDEIKQRIVQVTGFTTRDFPFRYLGVPITSKKISISDCDVLVDNITKRILCWTSRHLSYAARNVLVDVVLMSTHSYWA